MSNQAHIKTQIIDQLENTLATAEGAGMQMVVLLLKMAIKAVERDDQRRSIS